MTASHQSEESSRAALAAFAAQHPDVGPPHELAAGPAVHVERLDLPGAYLLVPIRDASGLRGVVQLNAETLGIESLAMIHDPATTFLAEEEKVLDAVKAALPSRREWRHPFLAWRPCRESFDSNRPFWVVPHHDGRAYVTQSLQVFEDLSAGRGG